MMIKGVFATGFVTVMSLFWFYSLPFAATFKVVRPGKVNISRNIKKVFINPKMINGTNDTLGLKNEVVASLKKRLNELGRFQVTVGPPVGFDPNVETVAVIQGDVISGGEVDNGQFTEKAVCKGGLSGIAGAVVARKTSKQGLTFSRRGMLCKLPNLKSQIAEGATSIGLGLLGVKEFPKQDEVIRVYKYKNFSLFCQVNLSFTQIGKTREMLAIRSDSASFSRHLVNRDSYKNVRESGDNAPLIWLWFRITPVAPVIIKNIGIVSASNPGSSLGKWYERSAPKVREIPRNERQQILSKLVNKSLNEFIRVVSPYQTVIEVEIASGGNSDAKQKIEKGKYLEARRLLDGATEADDLYNLGLTYEALATSIEDYEDAIRYYDGALNKSPGTEMYARGIGRMESQLRAFKRLKRQVAN